MIFIFTECTPVQNPFAFEVMHAASLSLQHMTANLVLHRPENALQFMIDWCKERQKECKAEELKSKALYEENKIDVYDEDILKPLGPSVTKKPDSQQSRSYGNSLLKPKRQSTIEPQPQLNNVGGGDTINTNRSPAPENKPAELSLASNPAKGDPLRPLSSQSSSHHQTNKSDSVSNDKPAATQEAVNGQSEDDVEVEDEDIISVSDANDEMSNDYDEDEDSVSVSTASNVE